MAIDPSVDGVNGDADLRGRRARPTAWPCPLRRRAGSPRRLPGRPWRPRSSCARSRLRPLRPWPLGPAGP
eukprot:10831909-Alexandrium_andersonii.AAC.1